MKDQPMYEATFTHRELLAAVEGARTNALDEATNTTCVRISAWLMRRSEEARRGEHGGDWEERADALEEAALDIRDGEWRRTT